MIRLICEMFAVATLIPVLLILLISALVFWKIKYLDAAIDLLEIILMVFNKD